MLTRYSLEIHNLVRKTDMMLIVKIQHNKCSFGHVLLFSVVLGVQNWSILVCLGVRAKSSTEERVFSWLLEDKQAYTRQEKEKKIPGREQHEQT